VATIVRLTAAVVAVAVAALTACASRPDRARTSRAAGAALVGIVGYRWRITEIRRDATALAIPPHRGAYLGLTADGASPPTTRSTHTSAGSLPPRTATT
jgi:hypothetical protein